MTIGLWIAFAPLSTEISDRAHCDVRKTQPQFVHSVEETRKIVIKGFIYAGEPETERVRLAFERANAVKRLLASSGLPDQSMEALALGEWPMGIDPGMPLVWFDLVPNNIPLVRPTRPPPPCSELGDGGSSKDTPPEKTRTTPESM